MELHAESALRLLSTVAAALLSAPSDISGLTEAERGRLTRLVATEPAPHSGEMKQHATTPDAVSGVWRR